MNLLFGRVIELIFIGSAEAFLYTSVLPESFHGFEHLGCEWFCVFHACDSIQHHRAIRLQTSMISWIKAWDFVHGVVHELKIHQESVLRDSKSCVVSGTHQLHPIGLQIWRFSSLDHTGFRRVALLKGLPNPKSETLKTPTWYHRIHSKNTH